MASKFNFGKRLCVTGHEYRKTDNGAAMRWGCSCENRFVSKRWHPSLKKNIAKTEDLKGLAASAEFVLIQSAKRLCWLLYL